MSLTADPALNEVSRPPTLFKPQTCNTCPTGVQSRAHFVPAAAANTYKSASHPLSLFSTTSPNSLVPTPLSKTLPQPPQHPLGRRLLSEAGLARRGRGVDGVAFEVVEVCEFLAARGLSCIFLLVSEIWDGERGEGKGRGMEVEMGGEMDVRGGGQRRSHRWRP